MSLYESPRKTSSKTAVHLWEFLLDLLLDEKSGNVIGWTNREAGEFKLKNQEEVARRWGNLKHRPGMNYDKLSRALRYYYQKGIIKKVNGQRLVYKFVNPPLVKSGFPQEITTKASQASQTVEATEKEPELKDKNETVEMPCPCVRTNAISLPQATLTSSSLGFRIIQAPLVSQGHMTYPMSMYPYIVPCVIPACRSVGVIKS